MKSHATINNMTVNLSKPAKNALAQSNNGPLQICQSNYEGDIGVASSHYISEEGSLVSAEYAALNHEELARKRTEDKEMKLQQFQNKTKANAARKMREEAAAK